MTGLKQFDEKFGDVLKDSDCACGRVDVVEKQVLRWYEIGPERCSKTTPGRCGIVQFLAGRRSTWEAILAKLKSIPDANKSAELGKAEQFLAAVTRVVQSNDKPHDAVNRICKFRVHILEGDDVDVSCQAAAD